MKGVREVRLENKAWAFWGGDLVADFCVFSLKQRRSPLSSVVAPGISLGRKILITQDSLGLSIKGSQGPFLFMSVLLLGAAILFILSKMATMSKFALQVCPVCSLFLFC